MYKELQEETKLGDEIPSLHLAFFMHFIVHGTNEQIKEIARKKILDYVEQESMSQIYRYVCAKFGWPLDTELLARMELENLKELNILNNAIELAEKTKGWLEVQDAYFKKGEFYSKIGDMPAAVEQFRKGLREPIPKGRQFAAGFHLMRISVFSQNFITMRGYIFQLKELVSMHDDWYQRNKFNVYAGIYSICIRDFRTACSMFMKTISSFSSSELMCYSVFIRNTIFLAMLVLPRSQFKKKIIDNPRIGAVLVDDIKLKAYMYSLYNCNYSDFFTFLAMVETDLKEDFLFHRHYRYYIREMKIVAYKQILASYSSLSIPFMAKEFKVTTEFLEGDISKLIYAGRLNCKINLETNRIENRKIYKKSHQFQKIIRQGDVLLNRVQKLSRMIIL